MRTNTKVKTEKVITHTGQKVTKLGPLQELQRTVLSCMLFDNNFYEDGMSVADRIANLVPLCDHASLTNLAIEAREKMKLRHVPLLIVREMARHSTLRYYVSDLLTRIIQRPDEITEYVAIYMKDGKQPLSSQSKIGLRNAFYKFDEYQFAKYRGEGREWSLRDVMFLVHPKPRNHEERVLFRKIANNTLETPDTWEVNLSRNDGVSKRDKWQRLLMDKKMGGLAVLRNLRNFSQEGVDDNLVRSAILTINSERILPFRFISAAIAAPQYEGELEQKFLELFTERRMSGRADLLVDVSASMSGRLSLKSDMQRFHAAAGIAMIARELFDIVNVYSFSMKLEQVPARRGFGLAEAIARSQYHGSTMLFQSIRELNQKFVPNKGMKNRLIVITDEQATDRGNYVSKYDHVYVINVAPYQYGIDYRNGVHINGFSEAVFDYIAMYEELFG